MSGDNWTDRWSHVVGERRGGDDYRELIKAARLLQDRVAGLALPLPEVSQVAARLRALADDLEPFQVSERDRWDGTRADVPGRAMPLLPPYRVSERGEGWLRGSVTFSRFFLGGGGAVHGGVHTLLFDDVMGLLAGLVDGIARTAYLTVNYRAITPLDVPLVFDCTVDRVEGRKRFLTCRLVDAEGALLSEADGLFVQLLPGQP